MKIIAQMDDISSININKDSTFAILLEAQNQNHEIYYYLPKELNLDQGIVKAKVKKIKLQKNSNNFYQIEKEIYDELTNYDIILVRQDPPFDMAYITSTYILEFIKDKCLIVNNPTEIRNCPEKIFVSNFQEFIPPTLISSDIEQIKKFKNKFGNIIAKPLYSCGGDGVFLIKQDDQNLDVLVKLMDDLYNSQLVLQKFIKEVKNGDKRILLLDGEIIGAVNRVAETGEIRSNFHAGGNAQKAILTKRDLEICKKIGPELKKRGLFFVGIDIIGDYLTEINVTSPTGIHEINYLNNCKIEEKIVQTLIKISKI